MPLDSNVPHTDLTYEIIGCAMRVQTRLGPGLKEYHYQKAMTAEMLEKGLKVIEEHQIEVYDGEHWIGRLFLDHIVNEKIVVECKAFLHLLTDEEVAQVITYLATADLKVGLLFNFGRKKLNYQRILPPKDISDWKEHARRYAWRPSNQPPPDQDKTQP
jgi:GxxExxY protein